ncbi:MAG TPA: glucose 1-dehydrogenase [Terracidiphilus sp.]|nr:glucose 1-dehydrogenase [Terracidiphilus sp.]
MKQSSNSESPFSLSGQLALVTGGGTGLGFAMTKALKEAGARVVIAGRRREILNQAVEALGDCSFAFEHDVTDADGAAQLVEKIVSAHGPLSILVNNAGVHLKKSLSETSFDDFNRVLATHVGGAFAMTRAAVPSMRRHGRGSVLFIASMTSLLGMPDVVAYSAAKSAYLGMVRSLATELAPDGIRVNAIAPGWIESPMLHQALDGDHERKARILSRTPLHRFGQPSDIGLAAVYLCSPAAEFVNGVVLPVDGGASIGF